MKFNYLLLICILLMSGCSDEFLDKEPLSDVTPESFFLKSSDLLLYTNGFYRMFPSTSIYDGDETADNIVATTLSEEMRGARTIPTTGGGWDGNTLGILITFLKIMRNVKMKPLNYTTVG